MRVNTYCGRRVLPAELRFAYTTDTTATGAALFRANFVDGGQREKRRTPMDTLPLCWAHHLYHRNLKQLEERRCRSPSVGGRLPAW